MLAIVMILAVAQIVFMVYRMITEDPKETDRKWKEYQREQKKKKKGCYGWVK